MFIYIPLQNKFRKTDTENRVTFLSTETTEETALSIEQFLPLEPGHCITPAPNKTFSELAICKSSFPSQKYISPAYRQEWQNGVRTWRRVTWFFFSSEALQRRRWHGANDGSFLGWGKQGGCCDEDTGVHQVYRRSESGPNQEMQTRDFPLWLNFYLILVKSWTFSGPWVPAK